MPSPSYLIQYDDISHLSIAEFIRVLNNMPGLSCLEMKVSDFIYCAGEPIHSGCGVYIFKENDHFFYVGKNSRKSFVERVPSHFDMRHGVWFNRVLQLVADHRTSTDKHTIEGIQAAGRYALDNLSVILINFYADGYWNSNRIEVLENLLRITLQPVNAKKGFAPDLEETIGGYVERHQRFVDMEKTGKAQSYIKNH